MSGCVDVVVLYNMPTTCLGESKFMGYKYECIAYLDVYQAALTRRRTPNMHYICRLSITLLHFGVVEHSAELLLVMGVY
jgi:hypothetical protein